MAIADKKLASFWVGKGLMHKGVSMMPVTKRGFFLEHAAKFDKKVGHKLRVSKWNRKTSFRKAATWFPIETKCK